MDHELLNAKIGEVKAQNDARFSEVLHSIKGVADQVRTNNELLTGRLNTIDSEIKDAKQASKDAETAAKSVRWNIIFTGLTVAALIYAGFALWNQAIEMTTGVLSSSTPGAVADE